MEIPIKGIANRDNTCYLNCILQSFIHLKTFQNYINQTPSNGPLTSLFREIYFIYLSEGLPFLQIDQQKKRIIETVNRLAGGSDLRYGQQNDAHEVMTFVLTILEDESTGAYPWPFSIDITSKFTCRRCQNRWVENETSSFLIVPFVARVASVRELISRYIREQIVDRACSNVVCQNGSVFVEKEILPRDVLFVIINRYRVENNAITYLRNLVSMEPLQFQHPFPLSSSIIHTG